MEGRAGGANLENINIGRDGGETKELLINIQRGGRRAVKMDSAQGPPGLDKQRRNERMIVCLSSSPSSDPHCCLGLGTHMRICAAFDRCHVSLWPQLHHRTGTFHTRGRTRFALDFKKTKLKSAS